MTSPPSGDIWMPQHPRPGLFLELLESLRDFALHEAVQHFLAQFGAHVLEFRGCVRWDPLEALDQRGPYRRVDERTDFPITQGKRRLLQCWAFAGMTAERLHA